MGRKERVAMTALLELLTDDVKDRLRAASHTAEDVDWPAQIAHMQGWAVANSEYQARQRELGQLEMRALLDALNLEPPLAAGELKRVLLEAIELYFHTNGIAGTATVKGGEITVDVIRCPLFDHFMDPKWSGLTACGCFARRHGWYDALGIPLDEDLVMSRKWDDPVCETAIHLPVTIAAVR
jgi:hypothetical protein